MQSLGLALLQDSRACLKQLLDLEWHQQPMPGCVISGGLRCLRRHQLMHQLVALCCHPCRRPHHPVLCLLVSVPQEVVRLCLAWPWVLHLPPFLEVQAAVWRRHPLPRPLNMMRPHTNLLVVNASRGMIRHAVANLLVGPLDKVRCHLLTYQR